jgi:negative regulator of sigma E activity
MALRANASARRDAFMARTRIEPLNCARLIIFECMRRELETANHTLVATRVAKLVLFYERLENRSAIALPAGRALRATKVRFSAPEKPWTTRLVAMMATSALSCVAALTWLAVLLAIQR